MFRPTSERSIERVADDGYRTKASVQLTGSIKLTIRENDGTQAFDVLDTEDRLGLAAFLLAGLTRDQILAALPIDLLTADSRGTDAVGTEADEIRELIAEYMTAEPENRANQTLTTWIVDGLSDNGWPFPSQMADHDLSVIADATGVDAALRTEYGVQYADAAGSEPVAFADRDAADSEVLGNDQGRAVTVQRLVTDWVEASS